MKNRAHFSKPFGTLNVGMFLVTTMYIFMGLLGYLAYGDSVKASISYTIDPESKYVATFLSMFARKTRKVF